MSAMLEIRGVLALDYGASSMRSIEGAFNGERIECRELLRCRNEPVSYTHLRAHETGRNLVCRLLLEKKKNRKEDSYHHLNLRE